MPRDTHQCFHASAHTPVFSCLSTHTPAATEAAPQKTHASWHPLAHVATLLVTLDLASWPLQCAPMTAPLRRSGRSDLTCANLCCMQIAGTLLACVQPHILDALPIFESILSEKRGGKVRHGTAGSWLNPC
eukprot:359471-Chlamydomonas_euryale.AAC.3